ncbi:hypothetical protein H6G00_33300 [Leptolyngbya sp. FACHB-541]|uniref:TnsD family Tn7-like transposition protein n=1 Tax=Leptolyngbya sp. FACHB-541 TaxID=2692810 RepID=UPI001686C221|nr:TnsD family Tn7-like transposition protein [Leptolyngbya sp. FACHB-541]MBD2001418.1 hypothetical protein [Leptolyngbya sp. FACHB-541]
MRPKPMLAFCKTKDLDKALAILSKRERHSQEDSRKPFYLNNRVNWQERDQQILAQVKETVQELLTAEKPIRITGSKVAKALGQLTLVEQHLDQMPQTQVYLNSVLETIEDFQIRRVRWAVELLNQRGEQIERWKTVRYSLSLWSF